MNKERKLRFYDVISSLDEAIGELQDIQSDEEEAYYALPEGLQASERGDKMQEWIDFIDETVDEINTVIDKINSQIK